ncbi:MAG: hypothetical protein KAI08_08245 [Bacteroidales bacterium]|nr:hypothetical protein [Bacteroidales bacterium]
MKLKTHYFKLHAIVVLLLTVSYCAAQDQADTLTYYIQTTDGNTYRGQILTRDSLKVLFNLEKFGEHSFLKTEIKKMQPLDKEKLVDDEYWMDNPQATRYFFSPNAYGLKKGEGYYQNVWVMVNSFAVGVTDYFSIGGGVVPLFLFAGSPTPVWITPKFSIPVVQEKFNLGGGALLGTVLGEEETGFGILYGISTLGSKDKNVSLGLGYGYAGGDWAKAPMINLNTMIRFGPKGYFISENYFIQTEGTTALILSLGGRHIIQNAGLDYGLIIPFISEMDSFIAFPWLGITIPFGNK